jgi:hypothetical protein
MLVPAFLAQIQQRFSHEKRARVCVWFDPQEEFRRLLPIFQAQLAKGEPPTFHLLAYDPKAKHGQLWLKHQVWLLGQADPQARFVLYLPLAEERWHGPDERGKHHLELLTEYRITGTDWKVGGKRPTLFSFLKSAGAAVPSDQAEQRKLADGGPDSLLAKFAAKFATKPALFWEESLTAELAQSRVVGDVDQKLLDLAVEPETEWAALRDKGVLDEFLAAVAEELGDTPQTDNPVLWVKSLVERLALTEAFVGYGEAADFPFGERLPPARFREAHVALLRRWLRDANCRPAWDRWIAEVEQHHDLTEWAKGKTGAAYGFPHLVSLRWQDAVKSFVFAATKPEAFKDYVAEEAPALQREAEYARAGGLPECDWDHLLGVTRFVESCRKLQKLVPEAGSAGECVRLFTDFAEAVDGQHLRLKAQAAELNLTEIGQLLDRTYGTTVNDLNLRFFGFYMASDSADLPGLPFVTAHLDTHLWPGQSRRAIVIVDALRYDVAHQLKATLTGYQVSIEPLRAMLPTRTPVGMSALLPAKFTPTALKTTGGELHPIYQDADLSVRENRLALLKEFGAETRDITEIENSKKPGKLPTLLVVFGHEELDSMGHGAGETLIRHVQKELERLARVVRKLHQWGYPEVHLVTDHGFVLLDEEYLPPPVPINKEWCSVFKERFAIVPASADLPLKTKPFAWDAAVRVALPPGLAYFKAEKSFSHGGAALQELVIPHLVSRHQSKQQKIGVEILIAGAGLNLTSAAVKIVMRPLAVGDGGEMAAMVALPRNLEVNVVRSGSAPASSILPRGEAKKVTLKAETEAPLTLFFDSKFTFKQGDTLRLEIRDADTGEQFPGPEGTTLHVARDL